MIMRDKKEGREMYKRNRKLRKNRIIRNLVKDIYLEKDDLIYPIFIKEGENIKSVYLNEYTSFLFFGISIPGKSKPESFAAFSTSCANKPIDLICLDSVKSISDFLSEFEFQIFSNFSGLVLYV